jgi:hypothetical protein
MLKKKEKRKKKKESEMCVSEGWGGGVESFHELNK